jgi:hypothetical protein
VLSSSAVNEARRSVVLSYRNGSLQLAVTLRPARRGGAQATDPFGGDSVLADGARSLTISSGAFSQRKAWTSTAPVDHVWVAGPRMEAIVAGDPPVATLVKVVASLQ